MRLAATGGSRRPDGAQRTALAHPALAHVRAACRLCGVPVHGFLNGTTCVLQVDGRALQASCRGEAQACPGLREAVRAARTSRQKSRQRP
ncbi:hypothetical protein FF100_16300 [Methylobacterium terricola]|uniref:Uncharacterized protein n=1 Tax=Methylobacterium terricola TaxID=2583531 RepID=A0A5C4LGR0_9HYPH|nr:hypothetical protein [Methylobacterium terricola]TNC12385.1 hypothetical protein FF100_16300 [Methylobacterium terricola]